MAKRKHPTELPTAADWSRQGRRNSQNSPWRHVGRTGSPRQRACVAYFDALEAAGDTRRIPRPELDQ